MEDNQIKAAHASNEIEYGGERIICNDIKGVILFCTLTLVFGILPLDYKKKIKSMRLLKPKI